jgi:NAD+ kinase
LECPRGEIGRHNGLKIRAFLECQFESGRGHQFMTNKFFLVFDKTKSSLKIKNLLIKKIKITSLKKCNIIIVLGGDGFMLQALKKFYNLGKYFYGVNSGNYGFLMNKFSNKGFLKNLENSKNVRIHPLEMIVRKKNNQIEKSIAINEVSILRQNKQASSISITANKKNIIKKLISDGVLVSTPAGSTAYNLSAHGPILNLDSNKLTVTPISPFRPRRWRGTIVSDKSKIIIKNLDVDKRPISAVADNFEVRNAKTIKIQANKKIHFNLLYDKNNSLHKKIKIEQARKETSNK